MKMTLVRESATPSRMGRKKRWHEAVLVKFPAGTRERIDAVLAKGEERTAFIRQAVERWILRREKAQQRKPGRRS
jgi:hypothetical protein